MLVMDDIQPFLPEEFRKLLREGVAAVRMILDEPGIETMRVASDSVRHWAEQARTPIRVCWHAPYLVEEGWPRGSFRISSVMPGQLAWLHRERPGLLRLESVLAQIKTLIEPMCGPRCMVPKDAVERLPKLLDVLEGLTGGASVAESKPVGGKVHADTKEEKQATRKPKRSTSRGEGRVKLIASLTRHHEYNNGSCGTLDPIGNNALARQAGVGVATASEFFKNRFKGYGKYRVLCIRNPQGLVHALKLLNGEYAPHDLYGATPPQQGDPNDDD